MKKTLRVCPRRKERADPYRRAATPLVALSLDDDGYLANFSQRGIDESRYLTPDMQLQKISEKRTLFISLRDDKSHAHGAPGFYT